MRDKETRKDKSHSSSPNICSLAVKSVFVGFFELFCVYKSVLAYFFVINLLRLFCAFFSQ
jgi:hypothetical protein